MSWNTVRPGMSVFSKNTGPYRMISAPQYALFHTVVDLEALPTTTWGTGEITATKNYILA